MTLGHKLRVNGLKCIQRRMIFVSLWYTQILWINPNGNSRQSSSESFEQYFVVPSWLWARYKEDLMERMCDKAAYTRLLHGLGFDFILLPQHPLSDVTKKYFIYQDMQRFLLYVCRIRFEHVMWCLLKGEVSVRPLSVISQSNILSHGILSQSSSCSWLVIPNIGPLCHKSVSCASWKNCQIQTKLCNTENIYNRTGKKSERIYPDKFKNDLADLSRIFNLDPTHSKFSSESGYTGQLAPVTFLTPEQCKGYSKAGNRKTNNIGRKKRKSLIATDTPEKTLLEANNINKRKLTPTLKDKAKKMFIKGLYYNRSQER
ncbi:hypothetical protein HELRODRAFT_184171 [Helobdella robusta]|uniref:Uncharacterized protein n=1 Tax=Helobdella robusta TaxID=6412 RepID=T1FKP8_HELRO|nr:hypothetical protein HELRODRAFT_184171 [Helobdella robusta]ESO06755.1 hypothetical protein HELRODRAFT_184171 [Helobdella robusta]